MFRPCLAVSAVALLFMGMSSSFADIAPVHGLAMHGTPKYPADFKHLEYVNPDAPKGGEIHLAEVGTFDSLNPFIVKGDPAPAIGMTYMTLMASTQDEAFSEYGLIAESVEMPEDRSWVAFNLRKEAKWHDGKPITAEDVVWTFNTLMKEGQPYYHTYYANVKEVKVESPTRVRFNFKEAGNRELPLIIGQLTVLPKHYWEGKKFNATTLTPPLGSGPYKVKSVDVGHRVTYERVKDWWAKDLPINKGQYNFDTITYDDYRDETVQLQALFAGAYDFRAENIAKAWATAYDQKPVKEGLIKKEEIQHSLPQGMQGFVYNLRRPLFQDVRVREALGYAFDFEWSNKQFAFGAYKRMASYFDNSELASQGVPTGHELEILEKHRAQLPPELFTTAFKVPKTSGTGQDMRANLSKAKDLLKQAGWVPNAQGVLEKDGKPFTFEILLVSPAFERWCSPFIANLKKIGVQASLRIVDLSQYKNRTDSFDYDMIVNSFGASLSPGNELRAYWGSERADATGSQNAVGVKNPVVDDLITQIIGAPNREELVTRVHALDRVLLWNYYVIPQWYIGYFRIASWDKFGRPVITPKYGLGAPDTWWYDAQKADKIAAKLQPQEKK